MSEDLSRVYELGSEVPDVAECHGHWRRVDGKHVLTDETCPQCDGGHDHRWVITRIRTYRDDFSLRCLICGTRCCGYISDAFEGTYCRLRRHHSDHHDYGGRYAKVGA